MQYIDALATEDNINGLFVHCHALKLLSYLRSDDEYIANLCYWLISNLTDYDGECAYALMPSFRRDLSIAENKCLYSEATKKAIQESISILVQCSGNLLHPEHSNDQLKRNGISFDNQPIIGFGSFGTVYLIDGYAVKLVPFINLELQVITLLRETVALAILGRLRFIGMNASQYYIGIDYLPNEINFDEPLEAMKSLTKELSFVHSHGIIHCDIKLDNIRVNSEGQYRLIDFGSSRFSSSSNAEGFTSTNAYRDYLLFTSEMNHSYEVDIWGLGIVFYILETKHTPWDFPKDVGEYPTAIRDQYDSVLKNTSSLVKGMLSLTLEHRLTLEQIIEYLY